VDSAIEAIETLRRSRSRLRRAPKLRGVSADCVFVDCVAGRCAAEGWIAEDWLAEVRGVEGCDAADSAGEDCFVEDSVAGCALGGCFEADE
jgi:hypothetical protein